MWQKIRAKLNNKHFLALLGNVVLAVFGIAMIALLTHTLPIADMGKWFFFMTVLALCDAIRNGFLGTATVKFYAGTAEHRAREVLGSVWTLAIGITAIVVLIDVAAYPFRGYIHDEALLLSIKWLGLTFVSSLPFSVIFWKLQADEDYVKMLWLRMVNSGSMLVSFIVLIALKKMTLEAAMLYNFLTNCLTSLVGILGNQAKLKTLAHRTKETITEVFHFGKYSLGTTLSSTMLRSVDTFIITALLGPAAVAIYALPGRLMEIIEIPLRSFVGTGISGMARAVNNDDMGHVSYIFRKYAGMLTIAFIPLSILALFFAGVPVVLLGGHKYQGTEAIMIYRCLMIFCLMYPIDRFNGITLDVIHKPKINFYKVLVMLAVNAIGDYVLILVMHNVYGALIASFFTTFTGLVFGYYWLNKYMRYNITGVIKTGYEETRMLLQHTLRSLLKR